jgi:hypothetical protein
MPEDSAKSEQHASQREDAFCLSSLLLMGNAGKGNKFCLSYNFV